MSNYFIALEIPAIIKKQLALLCFGPPQINWIEQSNLFYIIRPLGTLSDLELNEVTNRLKNVFFLPFTLTTKRISQKQLKGIGAIGIEFEYNAFLLKLNKEIEQSFRTLNLKKIPEPSFPIILGYYENINFDRLSDYLMANSTFSTQPIQVSELILLHARQTPRRTVFDIIEYYPAFNPINTED